MDLVYRLRNKMLMPFIFVVLFALSFLHGSIDEMWAGYVEILRSPSVLISDYLYIGGFGATMFNVSTILLINIIMINRLKMHMTGPIFAGILTIAGFSFFGKNIFNTIPIYIGIYLYAKMQGLEFKSFMIVVLFSTGISPIVSFLIFGGPWSFFIGVPLGIVVGIFTGFILPSLTAHMARFHKGYNLYNIGFTMGIISMVYSAILTAFDIDFMLGGPTSEQFHNELFLLTILLSTAFIIAGFVFDRNALSQYRGLMQSTGRLVSDFVRDYGRAVTMLNVGVMGIISLIVLMILGIEINGPVMGGILTVMGFGAFGKHPRNALPVMAGALLAAFLTPVYALDDVGIAIAVLFVTAIAPIAGRYGALIGVLAGFLHIIITPLSYLFQGGFDLYNNGFAAGFVAAFMIPFLEAIKKDDVKEAQS